MKSTECFGIFQYGSFSSPLLEAEGIFFLQPSLEKPGRALNAQFENSGTSLSQDSSEVLNYQTCPH